MYKNRKTRSSVLRTSTSNVGPKTSAVTTSAVVGSKSETVAESNVLTNRQNIIHEEDDGAPLQKVKVSEMGDKKVFWVCCFCMKKRVNC